MKKTNLIALGVALASTAITMAQDADAPAPARPSTVPGNVFRQPTATAAGRDAQPAELTARSGQATANAYSYSSGQAGTQKRMMMAQAYGGNAPSAEFFTSDPNVDLAMLAPARTAKSLIIPKEAGDPQMFSELEEDLGVMAHILDKTVSNGDRMAARAMGIAVFSRMSGTSGLPQNLYLEGHGAIFVLNANFPLQPPPAKEPEVETKEPMNNEWDDAKREMSRPGGKGMSGNPFGALPFEERVEANLWATKTPPMEYDESKVENLKKDLFNALKNAANIRRLKADETITVVVSGTEVGVTSKTLRSAGNKSNATRTERTVAAKASAGERSKSANPAKLMFRVRKADAEAFQNNNLNFDDFRKKVTVIAI